MAATKYTYSISVDTANGKVFLPTLQEEIEASSIVTALDYMNAGGDVLDIWFVDALSAGDQTTLTGVVNAHTGVVVVDIEDAVTANVLDKDLTAPPGSPANGDRYIVAATATGAWAGYEGKIAQWNASSSAWDFYTPLNTSVYVEDESVGYHYNGSAWTRDQASITAYDGTGAQTFTNLVTIDLNATTISDPIYSLASAEITVNETGRFRLSFDVSLKATSGNARSQVDVWIERNSVEEPSLRRTIYTARNSYGSSASGDVVLDVTSGDVFRIRADRTAGSSTIGTVANGTRLSIERS